MARRNQNIKSEDEAPKVKISRESLRELGFVFQYLKPYRAKFITGLVFIVLSAFSTMLFPMLIGGMIDVAMPGTGLPGQQMTLRELLHKMDISWLPYTLDSLLILVFVQLILQMLFSFMRIYLLAEVGERAVADLRSGLFSKLLTMPMSFYSERRVGELSSRLSSDASQIQDAVSFLLAELLRGIFTLLIGLVMILFTSAELTLVMLSVVPVIAVLAVVFGYRIRKMSRKVQDQLADSGVVVQEAFQGIATVKAFTNELFEKNRYTKNIMSVVSSAITNARYRGAFVSFMIFSVFGAMAFVVWYGVKILPPGQLVTFVIFSAFVGGTIAGFADMFSQLQKTLGATQRMRELMKETGEHVNVAETFVVETPYKLTGSVSFDQVAFSYPSRKEVQVLKNVSLEAGKGEQIAIVGPSGAGKSTITALLLQFYKPDSGTLFFDGRPASDFPISQLRGQMALVPQDVMLFGGTIYENIIYGNPAATRDEVEEAARKANAHEFISEFPEGYETVVGERGVKLSGGQRQRIAIARAVLKDPAILILDEATSSLDSESEKLVQEALDSLMQNRTSFVIAHRLSTIRHANKILVLKDGIVAESGTHASLIQQGGLYKRLLELQFQE